MSAEQRSATLPSDSTLLPLETGGLLVSASHATFCRIPPAHLSAVDRILNGQETLATLDADLRLDLQRHGWMDPPRPAPGVRPGVQLQLTNACNLACAYCCTDSGEPRRDELDLAGWTAAVDDAIQAMGRSARFALLGGEPLLQPFALDLAEYLCDRVDDLTLFTNGIPLADPTVASGVAALSKRGMKVRVSLAGITRESCDRVSAAPRFDAALAGVRAVATHGAEVLVDIMLLPGSVDEIATELPSLRAQLPSGARVTFGLMYLGGRESGEHVFLSRAELESALDRVAFDAGEVISAPARSPLATRREACTCALGHHLHVRSDGRLYSCFRMEEPVGDLQDERFSDVVQRIRANPRPARMLPFCQDCALASLCGGACRSENLLLTGDPEIPLCGPWRVRVLSELLAEDQVSAVEWPTAQLASEARHRGLDAPDVVAPAPVADPSRVRLPTHASPTPRDGCRRA